jgi:ketosteroid isomerase-like protein
MTMQRSSEIEQLVHIWFAAASSGDGSVVQRHVSSDEAVRLVGSDPAEWLQGGQDVARFLTGEVEGAAGNVRFTPSETEAFEEGTVGWAATKLTITLPDGKCVSPRWTSVFHREGGVWKFVQTHASIGVPNDQVGWEYT